MKKLPYGISNYENLIENGYYYVDKTHYLEKLENLSEKYIMFLRPRKFGKTLFTSTLEYYYDINASSKFEKLFSNTYIGKKPTILKNRYHILRFNFSGIDTSSEEATINGFKILGKDISIKEGNVSDILIIKRKSDDPYLSIVNRSSSEDIMNFIMGNQM